MNLLIGIIFLGIVLCLFTLFTSKAPNGSKAMGSLANAAIASFLVEAFHKYVGGDLIGLPFLGQLGEAASGLGGVAAAGLVALAMGVSPVYAFVIAVSCGNMDLLPGFVAAYIASFGMKWMEEKLPDGLDLIAAIIVIAPITRLIATGMTPVVDASLMQIGNIIKESTTSSPILMGVGIRWYYHGCSYCTIKFNGINCFTWINWYTYGYRSISSVWFVIHEFCIIQKNEVW